LGRKPGGDCQPIQTQRMNRRTELDNDATFVYTREISINPRRRLVPYRMGFGMAHKSYELERE
jgi:hypothetical protein